MTLYRLPEFRRKFVLGSIGLAVVSISLRAQDRAHHEQVREAQTVTVRERIVAGIEPLCRILLPAEDRLHFQLTPFQPTDRRGGLHNDYAVECLDDAGDLRLRLLWDEDTRRCFRVSVMSERAYTATRSPATPSAAVSAPAWPASRPLSGGEWMCRLGLVDPHEARQYRSRVERTGPLTLTRLFLPGRAAIAWTDTRTGALHQVAVYPLPDVSDARISDTAARPAPPDA